MIFHDTVLLNNFWIEFSPILTSKFLYVMKHIYVHVLHHFWISIHLCLVGVLLSVQELMLASIKSSGATKETKGITNITSQLSMWYKDNKVHVCKDLHLYSENKGFKKLVQVLKPNYVMVQHKRLTEAFTPRMYKCVKDNIPTKFCFVTTVIVFTI